MKVGVLLLTDDFIVSLASKEKSLFLASRLWKTLDVDALSDDDESFDLHRGLAEKQVFITAAVWRQRGSA